MTQIDWSQIRTTHGLAHNFPSLFHSLSLEENEKWMPAFESLLEAIYHQGTIVSATSYALLNIIDIIPISTSHKQTYLLGLFSLVASSVFSSKLVDEDDDLMLVEQTKLAVRQCADRLASGISDYEPRMFVEYCILLNFIVPFPVTNISPLVARMLVETDSSALSTMIWLITNRYDEMQRQIYVHGLNDHTVQLFNSYPEPIVRLSAVYYVTRIIKSNLLVSSLKFLIHIALSGNGGSLLPWEDTLLDFTLKIVSYLNSDQIINFYAGVLDNDVFTEKEHLDIGVALLNICFPDYMIDVWRLGLQRKVSFEGDVQQYYFREGGSPSHIYKLNQFQKTLLLLLFLSQKFWLPNHNLLTLFGLPAGHAELGAMLEVDDFGS